MTRSPYRLGDANHYDRYWFNGHQRDGEFYFGAAMGHYPSRGVIDAAFSLVFDGVEHSIFASGAMPPTASTTIGPIRIEVVEPMRTIRYVVEPNEHGIACDLTFRATTVAVEEPRQQRRTPEGILLTDHTRLTQWGTWQGTVTVDGNELQIDPLEVSGTAGSLLGGAPDRSADRGHPTTDAVPGVLAMGAIAFRGPLHPSGCA